MNNPTSSPSANGPALRLRSPWPYAIAGYFLVVLIAIGFFVTWILGQNMDLVRRDYYEHEILFQKQIDAINRTRPWGGEVAATYDYASRTIRLHLPVAHLVDSFAGELHLYRPSNARLDQRHPLRPDVQGFQHIAAAGLAPGLWKARLQWSVDGQDYWSETSLILGE